MRIITMVLSIYVKLWKIIMILSTSVKNNGHLSSDLYLWRSASMIRTLSVPGVMGLKILNRCLNNWCSNIPQGVYRRINISHVKSMGQKSERSNRVFGLGQSWKLKRWCPKAGRHSFKIISRVLWSFDIEGNPQVDSYSQEDVHSR